MKRLISIFFATLTLIIVVHADETQFDEIPELEVLENYVGIWETEVDTNKGQTTTKWILGGRFVEKFEDLRSGDVSIKRLSIMTYDVKKKVYRIWEFAGGNGFAGESEGHWDAKKRTMTFVQRDSGNILTTVSDFSEAGMEKLQMVTKDAKGKIIENISGRSIRKKK